jgi:hypothetical protein
LSSLLAWPLGPRALLVISVGRLADKGIPAREITHQLRHRGASSLKQRSLNLVGKFARRCDARGAASCVFVALLSCCQSRVAGRLIRD